MKNKTPYVIIIIVTDLTQITQLYICTVWEIVQEYINKEHNRKSSPVYNLIFMFIMVHLTAIKKHGPFDSHNKTWSICQP